MPSRQGRRRIGLLLPSSNTTQEFEFTRVMPDGVTLHVARLQLSTVELSAAVPRSVEDIEIESRKLADADVDAILLSTTVGGFANGIGYDQELIERIETVSSKKATRRPSHLSRRWRRSISSGSASARLGARRSMRPPRRRSRRVGFRLCLKIRLATSRDLEIGLLDRTDRLRYGDRG